jgi:hypothetical protein
MARKHVYVSDKSGEEIPEGTGATVTVKYNDPRRGVKVLDVTDAEADELGGRPIKRRGRPPKVTA